MQFRRKAKSKGSALLTALFIMTLVAIAATAMTLRLKIEIAKTQTAIESDAISLQAQLPLFWGLQWLVKDPLKLKQHKNPAIVATFPTYTTANGMKVSGQIIDLQSRFNLNNIKNITDIKIFKKLLLHYGANKEQVQAIIKLSRYWIKDHRLDLGRDSSLDQFLKQKPPYYPGYRPFISVSELRLIPGVNAKLMNGLRQDVTALPESTPINILTASPVILKNLGDGLNQAQISRIIELRSTNQLNKSKLLELLNNMNIPQQQVTISSNFFLIISEVSSPSHSVKQLSIIQRKASRFKKQINVDIIYHSSHTL